jgi:hypothetical protein
VAKIAVLMMVHKNETQTNRLVNHLARDFDIYVHVDRRSGLRVNTAARVFVYREYESYWGSYNLIMASLLLFREAWKRGYDRYVLVSGQDLPLKPNHEIAAFFENNPAEYIDTGKVPRLEKMPRIDGERLRYYYPDITRRPETPPRFFRPRADGGPFAGPHVFFRDDSRPPRELDYDFYGGAQWINLTRACVTGMLAYLETDRRYEERFRETFAGDEVFYQTLAHLLPGLEVVNDCLRYVDWTSGPEMPRTLRMNDYGRVMRSACLFARKFDEAVDGAVIDRIYHAIE